MGQIFHEVPKTNKEDSSYHNEGASDVPSPAVYPPVYTLEG